MFKFTKKDKRTELEKEADRITKIMNGYEPYTQEYTAMAKNRSEIEEAVSKEKKRAIKISPESILSLAGTIFVTVWVTKHEKFEVITTKVLGYLPKGRV